MSILQLEPVADCSPSGSGDDQRGHQLPVDEDRSTPCSRRPYAPFAPPTTSALEKKLQPAISEMPPTPLPELLVGNIRKRTKLLWFNVYRRFFTFCGTLNGIGLVLAALNKFLYARNHLGSLVLDKLFTEIPMRYELFLRFLYLIAIHGLRAVS